MIGRGDFLVNGMGRRNKCWISKGPKEMRGGEQGPFLHEEYQGPGAK